MPHKDFTIRLSGNAMIVVEFVTVRGQVVSLVVRLMLKTVGGLVNVVRYDTAHGMPHKDVLGKKGDLIRKEWLGNISLPEALAFAVRDLRENYEKYIRQQK